MGYKDFDTLDGANGEISANTTILSSDTAKVDLPDVSFVKDADIGRDGMDLVLTGPKGEIIIEDYFAQAQAPTLVAPDGSSLTPNLVDSFVTSNPLYADAGSMSDESPVGAVQEMTGDATVTRVDGTTESLQIGAPIFQGDIIETSAEGAVNIMFIDETSFAVSEDARLAIDEYVFDPSTAEGVTNFSVLKGMFVFTSGLIGREDPDDVHIETPAGSIGIRGTIIAGDADTGEITVIEGAIVLNDNFGNEITLANQFETAKFDTSGGQIEHLGQQSAGDIAGRFATISNVSPTLFSSIDDVANDPQQASDGETTNNPENAAQEGQTDEQTLDANEDGAIDGTVDENNDGAADGTIDGETQLQDGENTNAIDDGEEAGALPSDEQQSTAAEDGTAVNEPTQETTRITTKDPLAKDILSTDGQLSDGTKSANGGTQTTLSSGETLTNPANSATTNARTTSARTTSDGTKPIDGTTNSNDLPPPGTTNGTATNSFGLQVNAASIDENAVGGLVATVTGVNGDISSIDFTGNGSTYFDLIPSGVQQNTYDIFLKSGESFNFENMGHIHLGLQATSSDGAATSRSITPVVNDLNEAPESLDQASADMFSASSNQNWSYKFTQEFFDEDYGDNQNLTFTAIIYDDLGNPVYHSPSDGASFTNIDGDITGGSFNSTNGVLNINFGTVTADDWFTVEIIATDLDGLTESTGQQIFNTFQEIGDGTFASMSGAVDGGDVMSITSRAVTFNVSGAGNTVYLSNDDDIGIELDGSGGFIHGGDGEDQITVDLGTGYTVSGGNDNDSFLINNANNHLYGDSGSDSFNFQLHSTINPNAVAMMSNLMSGSGGFVFDGGSEGYDNPFFINFGTSPHIGMAGRTFSGGGDSVFFSFDGVSGSGGAGGTIDFSAMDNSIFRNIEILDFSGNADPNDVFLNYQDVFDMTDHKKTLVIRGDSNDAITIDTQSEQWQGGQQITDAQTGDVYDTYFVGDVTVLVDTDTTQSVV